MQCKRYEDFMIEYENYRNFLWEYRRTKEKFYDLQFHPQRRVFETNISLDDSKIEWIRIDDIYKAPLFDEELINIDYVQQGHLGNCSFVSALSRVAKQPELVSQLFDQNADTILGPITNSVNIECGAVVIFFHAFGRETPVLIDTLIPFDKYTLLPIFSRPTKKNFSPWFCLVEKAYAKLQGSYSSIVGVSFANAIYHLFGYEKRFINLSKLREKKSKKTPFEKISKYLSKGSVISTSIYINDLPMTKEELESVGLVSNHSYLLQKARSFKDKNFVCLRNPWARFEWNGDWSKYSPLWTEEIKEGLHIKDTAKYGTFWMIEKDYFNYFTDIEVSWPIPPEWHSKSFTIEMWPGESDGYDPNSPLADLDEKPNYIFHLIEDVPDTEKVKIYFLIERRAYLPDRAEITQYEPSHYYLLLVNSNGLKLTHDVYTKSSRMKIMITQSISCPEYVLNGNNQLLTIALQRVIKSDFCEECSVKITCKYKFELFNIDEPDNLIQDNEEGTMFFNNISLVHTLTKSLMMQTKKNEKKKLQSQKNKKIENDDEKIEPKSEEEIEKLKKRVENLTKEMNEIQKELNSSLNKSAKIQSKLNKLVNNVESNELNDDQLVIIVDKIEKKRNKLEKLQFKINSFLTEIDKRIDEIELINQSIREPKEKKEKNSDSKEKDEIDNDKVKDKDDDDKHQTKKSKKKVHISKPKIIPVEYI